MRAVLAVCIVAFTHLAAAQDYPSRPIRLIVTVPPDLVSAALFF